MPSVVLAPLRWLGRTCDAPGAPAARHSGERTRTGRDVYATGVAEPVEPIRPHAGTSMPATLGRGSDRWRQHGLDQSAWTAFDGGSGRGCPLSGVSAGVRFSSSATLALSSRIRL